MSDSANDSRLPPPAFPPGTRRRLNYTPPKTAKPGEAQAFISPDDPMPERGSRAEALGPAFISPDEPIPERKIELADEFKDGGDADEEGQVVGMDLNPHLDPSVMAAGGDPHVFEVFSIVERLAAALLMRGEPGLRMTDEMSGLETTLRACCAGYLAGRRAEDSPMIEAPLPSDG